MGPGPCTSSLKKAHCFPLALVFPSADSRGCLWHAGSGSVCQALGGEGTVSGKGKSHVPGVLGGHRLQEGHMPKNIHQAQVPVSIADGTARESCARNWPSHGQPPLQGHRTLGILRNSEKHFTLLEQHQPSATHPSPKSLPRAKPTSPRLSAHASLKVKRQTGPGSCPSRSCCRELRVCFQFSLASDPRVGPMGAGQGQGCQPGTNSPGHRPA